MTETANKPELKPCPFCGGKGRVIDNKNVKADFSPLLYAIQCTGCEMQTSYFYPHNVIEQWNKRI